MKMRQNLCVLAFLASASMAMAAVTPVTSVTINNIPGTPPMYMLQSITAGGNTFDVISLFTGTSTGTANQAAPYNVLTNMDNFDLNLYAARNAVPAPNNTIDTVLFGGTIWVDSNGTLPDFFLFEAAGSGNPDDVGVAPIFPDDTVGIPIDLPQTVNATGWGNTLLTMSGGPNNGQPIVGVCWDITDLKDASGNFLTSSTVIKGIRIMNGPANSQAGGLDPCLLAAVSAGPSITGVTPAKGTMFWPAANGVSFAASSPQPIEPAGITLVLNGINVSASLVIGGDPTSRTVSFNGLLTNVQYTGQIIVSNASGASAASLSFDTFSDTAGVVVEMEDYNYDLGGECDHEFGALPVSSGGGYQTNPPASGYDLTNGTKVGGPQGNLGYVDALGSAEVDYHDAVSVAFNPFSTVFRYCDFVGTRVAGDQRRQKYVASNLPEYEVFQMVTGDWMNYTRSFAPANYKVYLRTAGSAAGQLQLGIVGGDPTTTAQTVTPAGVFLLTSTGGTNNYRYVPMTDASGQNEVSVAANGINTFRLTSQGTDTNSGFNYMIFVPTGVSLVPPVAEISAPTNGAEFPAGATIPVTVNFSDNDGTVTNLTVIAAAFSSTNILGVFATSPVNFSWTNVMDGNYTLTAIATDNDGLKGAALPVQIKVGNPPPPALFVVGVFPLNANDSTVFNRLAFLGLPVVVQLATATTSADGDGKQLIVISSSVLSGDVGTKFTASTTPVIQWEQALVDEFLISGAGSTLGGQREIVITDAGAAHPLGAGLPAGTNLVRTTAAEFHFATDVNLAPGAVVIARAANDTNTSPAIVGVDTAGTLNNGSEAPARRVNMFWGDSGLSNVNAAGLALFDAAVNWASGRAPAGPTLRVARSGNNLIISWPASTTGEILQESTDVANSAGWVNTSRTIDNDGTTKSVTIAAPTGNLFFRLVK